MKKSLLKATLLLGATLALGVAPFVGAEAKLQDGEYTAVSAIDSHGWSLKHTIVVKDGKIESSMYDYINDKGEAKSANEEYNKKMADKTGTSVADAMKKLSENLVKDQDPAKVEIVSGATHTAERFVFTSEVLLKQAAEGKTGEINVSEMPLVDGTYKLETEADEHGWAHEFTLVVKDGKIAESKYDMVKDGKMKSEDEEYNKAMTEKAGISFADTVKQLNEALTKDGDADKVEVVSGATNTSKAFKEYATKLIMAAKLGNQDVIKAELIK